MSEMIERIARVLCAQNLCDPDHLEPGDAYGIDGYKRNGDPAHFMWREFVEKARAVIEAMREFKMVVRHDGEVVHELRGAPDDIWKAMIDAALDKAAA